MALALSVKDHKPAQQNSSAPGPSTQAQQPPPQPVGQTAATVSRVRALFDFTPSEPGELAFGKGDIIAVLESVYKDWWKGSLKGQTGIFPLNYVEKLQDPTKEELEREAQMEAEVFAEMKNVEKLLALLSTTSESGRGDVRDNEEITTLYHSTLAIRPKLIELIGKYSQKKGMHDDAAALYPANNFQMTSPSSTRNSSKLVVIMNNSSKPPCHTHHNRHTVVQPTPTADPLYSSNRSTAILRKHHSQITGTTPPDRHNKRHNKSRNTLLKMAHNHFTSSRHLSSNSSSSRRRSSNSYLNKHHSACLLSQLPPRMIFTPSLHNEQIQWVPSAVLRPCMLAAQQQ